MAKEHILIVSFGSGGPHDILVKTPLYAWVTERGHRKELVSQARVILYVAQRVIVLPGKPLLICHSIKLLHILRTIRVPLPHKIWKSIQSFGDQLADSKASDLS